MDLADPAFDPRVTLAGCPLFAGLADTAIDWLATRASVVAIAGGEILFAAGDAPEHFYIVVAGRLRVQPSDGRPAADITRLEPIGEISLLTAEPRTAPVTAMRDSVLLKIAAADWLRFVQDHPSALLAVTRGIIQRMRRTPHRAQLGSALGAQTFAILPAHDGDAARRFADDLTRALQGCGGARIVDAARVDQVFGAGSANDAREDGDAALLTWLSQCESAQRYLLYVANPANDAWTQRCLRQADRVLVIGASGDTPQDSAALEGLRQCPPRPIIELVLLREEAQPSGDVAAWYSATGAQAHHYARPRSSEDAAAVARRLSGRGIGLVLGGGGARGFAHIGLIAALEELGIPIDLAGGTSMGAFFAALAAAGFSSGDMLRIARDSFVKHNYLNDFVLPRVSLIRGRKFLARLRTIFGDRLIEDLRTPYFCVTTNLTRGCSNVHEWGPLHLWLGVSMAVPGVAPPLIWNGELYADGGVLNGLPTDIMQSLGRGPIVASDVSSAGGPRLDEVAGPDPEALFKYRDSGISLVDILFRTATLTSESGAAMRAERADVYLRMPVENFAMFDWKKLDEAAERGYKAAMAQLTVARAALLNPGNEITIQSA